MRHRVITRPLMARKETDMKSGFRLSYLVNFDRATNPMAYLALTAGLLGALAERGFELENMEATPEGVRTSYIFELNGAPKLSREEVKAMADKARAGLAEIKNGEAYLNHPVGIYVNLEFHLDVDGPVEGILLRAGHMDLLEMLRANNFIPQGAVGSNEKAITLQLGLCLEDPLVYTPETHAKVSAALFAHKNEAPSQRVHKADPRNPGVPKYPQMIFQNAKIGYVLGSNTFRLGSKWFDTLKPGDLVEAVDGVGARLGWLVVKTVVRDTLASALKRDALANHGVREMEIESLEEGIEYLLHILVGVYPNTKLDNDTEVSVITFEPQFAPVEPNAFA